MAARYSVAAPVLKFITDKPGQVIYLEDVMAATKFTRKQVQMAIYNAQTGKGGRNVHKLAHQIETIVQAQAWRYMPNKEKEEEAKPEKMIYQEVGTTKSGKIIAEDLNGGLFLVTELEI